MRVSKIAVCFCLTFLFTLATTAQDHQHAARAGEEISLPDDLRILLAEEMNQIDRGMGSLVTSLAAGNWHEVATTAKTIEGSYILKQRLSEKQMHQLHELLPSHFQELDKAFHQDAGKFAKAAEAHDAEVAGLYFGRLVQGCMSCHSRYATGSFSGFLPKDAHAGH